MQLVKNTMFILIAIFIDGLQALLSAGISVIATFPGTTAGGAAGCAAGNEIAGQIGCWVGGSVLGLLGSTGNVLLAPVTVPIGIALGFAINTVLSIVGGAFLLAIMMFFRGNISWKRLVWGGGELIPGLNNIPFWTFFVIASLWDGAQDKKQRRGVLGRASFFLQPTRAVMGIREGAVATMQHARERGEEWDAPVEIPEPETEPQSTSGRELVRASERRTPLQDIRFTKPNVEIA